MKVEAENALQQIRDENSELEAKLREQAEALAGLSRELEELRVLKAEETADDRADEHWRTSMATRRSCFKRFVLAIRRRVARKQLCSAVTIGCIQCATPCCSALTTNCSCACFSAQAREGASAESARAAHVATTSWSVPIPSSQHRAKRGATAAALYHSVEGGRRAVDSLRNGSPAEAAAVDLVRLEALRTRDPAGNRVPGRRRRARTAAVNVADILPLESQLPPNPRRHGVSTRMAPCDDSLCARAVGPLANRDSCEQAMHA